MVRRIEQIRSGNTGNLKQIIHCHAFINDKNILFFIKSQLRRQHTALQFSHGCGNFQANDRSKFTLAQFRFDHLQKVIGLLFILFSDGITRHPKQIAESDLHAGKKQVKIIRNQIRQTNIKLFTTNLDKARHCGTDRHFNAHQSHIISFSTTNTGQ